MPREKTPTEIWNKKEEMDFTGLLKDYEEGGTLSFPVRRTMGTMVDYLLNKKKYPTEIVGAAILVTFKRMGEGLQFDGSGKELRCAEFFHDPGGYGSRGRELITYIREQCDEMLQKQKAQEMEKYAKSLQKALYRKPSIITRIKKWIKK